MITRLNAECFKAWVQLPVDAVYWWAALTLQLLLFGELVEGQVSHHGSCD